MRSLAVALGLGMIATVASAQDPQKLPTTKTVDTVNAVTVHNNRNVPVWVYLEYGKFDRRLGLVPAEGAQTLRLPLWAFQGLQSVRLYVHPEGEVADFASQQFTLERASQLTVTVPSRAESVAPRDTMMQVIPPEDLDEATLTVENARNVTIGVFARQGNFDTRLGTVPANGRTTLRFPRSVVLPGRQLTIFVHPEGGRDLAMQTLSIRPGQHLGLKVPPR